MWTRKRLLIWGKTYPEFSKTYYETVCTGAIDGETGRLVRIYPITLRHNKEQFAKYQWIEALVERNPKDYRPESFRIDQESIVPRECVESTDCWKARSEWVLREGSLFASLETLREAEARDHTSLGVIKPREITGFYVKRKTDEERREWEAQRELALQQQDLFVDVEATTKELRFMPIQYRVRFRCADPQCGGHDCSILDWEIYQLSRKVYATSNGSPAVAEERVLKKLREVADPERHDLHFFMGNTAAHPRNFMVVGLYYPLRPKPEKLAWLNAASRQGSLF